MGVNSISLINGQEYDVERHPGEEAVRARYLDSYGKNFQFHVFETSDAYLVAINQWISQEGGKISHKPHSSSAIPIFRKEDLRTGRLDKTEFSGVVGMLINLERSNGAK